MPSVILLRELEGVIDNMIEHGDDAKDIIDSCKDAVIESLMARNKQIPDRIKKLDIFRG